MIDTFLDWITRQWFEIGSFAVTCAALFYAHLAYRVGKSGLEQTKQAELNTLRIQTKAALNDARQAQVSLELTCQVFRANWASHARKQPLTLSRHVGLFDRSPIDKVQFEGRQFLQELDASSATLDEMDLQALEALGQQAKAISLAIQSLAGKLELPS
ncbi:hypothetical protein [Cypionkella sp. TWP1-2-1b2]|uniref:hypothetical protein n=1 Tax=Cypionkella sp. TWP1-2-1b2 TaxID=2804675 RepID=UPI003CF034B5